MRCLGLSAGCRTRQRWWPWMGPEANSGATVTEPPEDVVVDASVLVDILAGTELADAARMRLARTVLHAPAHLDAEVLSALGRLHRAGQLSAAEVEAGLGH